MQRNWREGMRPKRLAANVLPPLGGLLLVGDAIRRVSETPHPNFGLATAEIILGSGLQLVTGVANRRLNRTEADNRNLELLGDQMSHIYQNIIAATRIFPGEGEEQADDLTHVFVRSVAALALADKLEEVALGTPKRSLRKRLLFANQYAKQAIERDLQVSERVLEKLREKEQMPEADLALMIGHFKSQVRELIERAGEHVIPVGSLNDIAQLAIVRIQGKSPDVANQVKTSLSRKTLSDRWRRR